MILMERKKLLFLSNLNNKDSKNDNSSSSNSLKEKFLDTTSEDEKEKSMIINESKDIGEMDYKEFLNKNEIEEDLKIYLIY